MSGLDLSVGPSQESGKKGGSAGLTLVEVLVSVMIYAVIMAGLFKVTSVAMASRTIHREKERLRSEGRWALEKMVRHVRGSSWTLIPVKENNMRSILAVAEQILDLDADGFADADADKDGRIDEDWPDDVVKDAKPGIKLIDDNNDSIVDNAGPDDDDEDGTKNEDPIDGIDNDGDGAIDEDPAGKLVDEDGDSVKDEDPVEPVVFYLDTATNRLIERLPDYGTPSLSDWIETAIANDVTAFEVTRQTGDSGALLLIKLTLGTAGGGSVTLDTRVLSRKYS